MTRTVTVGLDGSPEGHAAAEWAAREAKMRGLPLRLVNVWEPVPPLARAPLLGEETQQHWAERSEMGAPTAGGRGRIPREAAEALRLSHPDVEITVEQLSGRPGEVLPGAVEDAELLALGSRGLSGFGGYLVGSVGLAVVAKCERPVVLVRAGEQAADEHTPDPDGTASATISYRPVVLGIDTSSPDDAVIAFAFDAAVRRDTALHVVHGWSLSPYFAYGLPADPRLNAQLAADEATILAEVLRPWRKKFPAVEVVELSRSGKAADHLVDASRDALLVVVGRRIRRSPFGTHIGPVTHAVLHHATAPVVVIPHP
ncbi:universal stress protein [Streptomyces lunaelactis]|uniref:universal stress protein n=1 Tax=Streptomyces lunaelactis TaxID=1535768 RepID=UPI0015844FAD|nr:universal stress protein [Streptomyces lunaelactis]NUK23141.1 universal stress protein [Streptomyces lunaelactis]